MRLKIKYYGLLVEATQCNEEVIDFSGGNVLDLRNALINEHSELAQKDFQVAQGLEIIGNDALITSDEVVLLPPFAGG